MTGKTSFREWQGRGLAVAAHEAARAAEWLEGRLALLPARWAAHVGAEHARRGGLVSQAANVWALEVTEAGRGRLPLSASDDDLREAAKAAAKEGADIAALAGVRGGAPLVALLSDHCRRWGIEPAKVRCSAAGIGLITDNSNHEKPEKHGKTFPGIQKSEIVSITDNQAFLPAIRRMLCARWWLRRLRRAHGRRCEGAAIRGGVIRRGLWPYASQDAVERRQAQRRRNARALDNAVIECDETAESLKLADVVAGSVANPEVKRGELMVRVRGCDAIAAESGYVCEFWTLTAPSRFHAQKINGATAEPNPAYQGATPKEAQRYLSTVWARARAAWKRRGLAVFGLRTAEPHHDGCPHWHLICYGAPEDVRIARWLLKRYALQDSGAEAGAIKRRFVWMQAKGARGAAYAAKYVSKNINGAGMEGARDGETGRKVSATVARVDAWAAAWGIRQFQFFGCPAVSIWRALRRLRDPVAVAGSMLERARCAADDADFAGFWRACVAGGLKLIYRPAAAATMYGDAAAARIAGVCEGARRALLPVKNWIIRWGGKAKNAAGSVFAFPRSGVINCTGAPRGAPRGGGAEWVAELFDSIGDGDRFAAAR